MSSVVVIGGGVAGIQAALDIAGHGIHVHLVEREPTIGGHMAQLDKTFPTNDCSMCILSPKMVDVARHPNITIHTCTEVESIEGEVGKFPVTLKKSPRYIDEVACTGCGDCILVCPVEVYNRFDAGVGVRKAIYKPHAQVVPDIVIKDAEHCIECGLCYDICGPDAIRRKDEEKVFTIDAASILITTGYTVFDACNKSQFGHLNLPDVITSLELERMINASGPTGGKIRRLSNGEIPKSHRLHPVRGFPGHEYRTAVLLVLSAACRPSRMPCSSRRRTPAWTSRSVTWTSGHIGKGYEEYLERAKALGIRFLRGMPSDVLADRNGMILQVENSETSEVQVIHPDLVVLSVGICPADKTAEMAEKFRIPRGRDRVHQTGQRCRGYGCHPAPGHLYRRHCNGGKGYPGQRGIGGFCGNAGIYRCSQDAIRVNESRTLWWDASLGGIRYVEQTLLPTEYRIIDCTDVDRLATAIRRLEIRGLPLLVLPGHMVLHWQHSAARQRIYPAFLAQVRKDAEMLRSTRPTAINLAWGIDRVMAKMSAEKDVHTARAVALAEAEQIAAEDTACCHAIGTHGATLLPDTCTVLTHCNAGALACSSWGTALGVIRSAVKAGKKVNVISCETRPLLQGATAHVMGTVTGRDPGDRDHGFHGSPFHAHEQDRCRDCRCGPDHRKMRSSTRSGPTCMRSVPVTTRSRSMSQHRSQPSILH